MIDSVLSQSFQDFEMIIVNDGSTDNTKAILQDIRHEKIQIIHTGNNGPSSARNTAISKAKAPIIFNLDADDKISPGLLEKAYDVFCNRPNAGIVFTNWEFFGARSGRMDSGDYSLKRMLFENRIISVAFFRKADWESSGGYCSSFIYGLEDWDLWLSILELGRAAIKIPASLVQYRTYVNPVESRSGRRKSDRIKSIQSLALIYNRHKMLYSKYPAAAKRFLRLADNIENENILMKKLRNTYFDLKQKYSYLIW